MCVQFIHRSGFVVSGGEIGGVSTFTIQELVKIYDYVSMTKGREQRLVIDGLLCLAFLKSKLFSVPWELLTKMPPIVPFIMESL